MFINSYVLSMKITIFNFVEKIDEEIGENMWWADQKENNEQSSPHSFTKFRIFNPYDYTVGNRLGYKKEILDFGFFVQWALNNHMRLFKVIY